MVAAATSGPNTTSPNCSATCCPGCGTPVRRSGPVAPSPALAALPYSAAVAARRAGDPEPPLRPLPVLLGDSQQTQRALVLLAAGRRVGRPAVRRRPRPDERVHPRALIVKATIVRGAVRAGQPSVAGHR